MARWYHKEHSNQIKLPDGRILVKGSTYRNNCYQATYGNYLWDPINNCKAGPNHLYDNE